MTLLSSIGLLNKHRGRSPCYGWPTSTHISLKWLPITNFELTQLLFVWVTVVTPWTRHVYIWQRSWEDCLVQVACIRT